MQIEVKDLLNREDYLKLSPHAREKYLLQTIEDILKQNKDMGISVSDLLNCSTNYPFTRRSVEKSLKILVISNKAYPVKRGQLILYFPNNRMPHPSATETIKIDGDKNYKLLFVENPYGKFLYIQENQKGIFGYETRGGIMIPFKESKKILKGMEKFVDKNLKYFDKEET